MLAVARKNLELSGWNESKNERLVSHFYISGVAVYVGKIFYDFCSFIRIVSNGSSGKHVSRGPGHLSNLVAWLCFYEKTVQLQYKETANLVIHVEFPALSPVTVRYYLYRWFSCSRSRKHVPRLPQCDNISLFCLLTQADAYIEEIMLLVSWSLELTHTVIIVCFIPIIIEAENWLRKSIG